MSHLPNPDLITVSPIPISFFTLPFNTTKIQKTAPTITQKTFNICHAEMSDVYPYVDDDSDELISDEPNVHLDHPEMAVDHPSSRNTKHKCKMI